MTHQPKCYQRLPFSLVHLNFVRMMFNDLNGLFGSEVFSGMEIGLFMLVAIAY